MQTSVRPGSSSEETRARIIAAAKEIYEQNGTRGTTTRVVAERAGVNEATLFRHFGSKNALLQAMRESVCSLTFFESVRSSLSGNLRDDLLTLSRSMVERMYTQRAMMCISLAEDAREDVVLEGPEWRGPIELLQRIEAYFAQQVAAGLMHGDPRRLAQFFMGMWFSYVVGRKIWNSHSVEPDALEAMVEIFLNGAK